MIYIIEITHPLFDQHCGKTKFQSEREALAYADSVMNQIGRSKFCYDEESRTYIENTKYPNDGYIIRICPQKEITYRVSLQRTSDGQIDYHYREYKTYKSALRTAQDVMLGLDLKFIPIGIDTWRNAKQLREEGFLIVRIEKNEK